MDRSCQEIQNSKMPVIAQYRSPTQIRFLSFPRLHIVDIDKSFSAKE